MIKILNTTTTVFKYYYNILHIVDVRPCTIMISAKQLRE